MNILDAIIYGVIQGFSEFLPISSSGHLALLPLIMKIQDPGVAFDLMMHLGTAFAVLIYFRKDILQYVGVLTPALVNFQKGSQAEWFVRNFLLTTFVSVYSIICLIPLSKMARNPWIIVANLVLFGIILWLADIKSKKQASSSPLLMKERLNWKMAIVIGLAQSLAIFPGVSRSGITLTAAIFLGMRRKDAGEFSFLLSLPIIFAGIFKEIPDLMKGGDEGLIILVVGIVTSFIVGLLTIHFFLKLISKINLGIFCVYRMLIAFLMILFILN